MEQFDITILGEKELRELLVERAERAANPRPLLDAFGLAMVRSTLKTFREGGRPKKWPSSRRAAETGGRTMRHKGELTRSITYNVDGNSVQVGTNLEYARIHQFGGVVRPRKAKALTVPVHAKAYGKRAADFPDLVYIPRKGKSPMLAMVKARKGRNGSMMIAGHQVIPYFILMKSVRIHARPFLQFLPDDLRKFDRMTERYLSTGEA